jgi:hypothetical protein
VSKELLIIPKIMAEKGKQIKAFPQHTNRASSIGHPCTRLLVLKRKHWKDIPMISTSLKLRFELGDIFEKKAVRDIEDAGIEIFQMQQPFFDEETNISGHIDGLIRLGDMVHPLEIKSSSPLVFPQINSINDMLNSKYPYMKAYPYQLETYMMLGNYKQGVFIFVDKSSGAYKEIWQDACKDRQAEIVEKARLIDEHLKNDTLPDCLEYDSNVCGKCDLVHICKPERCPGDAIIKASDDLIEALRRREEIASGYKEYKKLDKYVKEALKGKNGLIDEFFVERKTVKRNEYTVNSCEYTTTKITHI